LANDARADRARHRFIAVPFTQDRRPADRKAKECGIKFARLSAARELAGARMRLLLSPRKSARRRIMSSNDFVSPPKFNEYKERFKEFYKMERRDDGVILVQAHTNGGAIQLSVENHRSVGQMFKTVGADPQNEILIFTGTGDEFMMNADPEGFKLEENDLAYWAYEYAYKDGRINVSSLVNDLEIPTIGVINGPGFHTEMCLMCDITICSENAIIYDLHYDIGSVPGDGIHSCFQELLGVKRAAYALLTGQAIDA